MARIQIDEEDGAPLYLSSKESMLSKTIRVDFFKSLGVWHLVGQSFDQYLGRGDPFAMLFYVGCFFS